MSDNASVTLVNDSTVTQKINLCVYQAILEIQHRQPELLKEKYRNVPWHDPRNRTLFLLKLKEAIGQTQDEEALIRKVHKFMQLLLAPDYFELPNFANLKANIRSLSQSLAESDNFAIANHSSLNSSLRSQTSEPALQLDRGIAILLLDAENLQLDADTEKFLADVCTYAIQIKIAFANWRNMGKQDLEFHKRGYELIHVPAGKDSADVKMATVGSSIFVHYPTAKEVLVCSSDGVLTHLCTTLQTHGLTVYQVRKLGDTITVFNRRTHQIQSHSLKSSPQIPPFEECIKQLATLIKSEQKRTKKQWVRLAKISQLFQEKYKLTLSQAVSQHLPGKRARDIFIDNPAIFVIHQISERDEVYISLFEASQTTSRDVNNSSQKKEQKSQASPSNNEINSRDELEKILVELIETITNQSPENYVPVTRIGTLFQQQYGQSVTTVLQKLQFNVKFTKFLQSCSEFQLKQTDKGWEVTLRTRA
ncbi:MAG TPA: NYN domain-containing protein [Coleofasciculaceae cyanobacterium]